MRSGLRITPFAILYWKKLSVYLEKKMYLSTFYVKKLLRKNINVVVRVVLETDDSKLKNSVMTFYRIREKNLKKLIEKNRLLYKKE